VQGLSLPHNPPTEEKGNEDDISNTPVEMMSNLTRRPFSRNRPHDSGTKNMVITVVGRQRKMKVMGNKLEIMSRKRMMMRTLTRTR
jgi:hypothetical protein